MNKNQPLIFFNSLIILLLFTSCGDEVTEASQSDHEPLISEYGYKYWHHIQNDGPKPQVGDVAYYYFNWRVDDSLLMDGRKAEMISKIQVPKPLPDPWVAFSPTLEALKLMSVGDSLSLIVPLDSVDGRGANFQNFSNFYYDLVMVDIVSKEENMKLIEEERGLNNAKMMEVNEFSENILEEYRAGKLADKIVEKPSGLKYYIHEEGNGELPKPGETIYIRYHAMLADGRAYDSSYMNSHLYSVKVGAGSVVAGWDEALEYLKRGTKATIFVPSDLGYGEAGMPPAIPADSELAFYLEIVK